MTQIKEVYQITEKEGEKAHWTRIGVAFINRDDSLNVVLDCIPLTGKMHIREKSAVKKPSNQQSGKEAA